MRAPNVAHVNDRDLADFGFVIESITGVTDGVAFEWQTAPAAGRYGAIPLSPEAAAQFRDIVIIGHLERTTTLAAAYRELLAWVSRGLCEIRTGLATDRVYYGWYLSAPGSPLPPQMLSDWGTLSLTFRCHDPLAYDRYERVLKVSSTPSIIPQGSGPMAGAIRIHGPTTSPLVITKRDHAGRPTGIVTLGSSANPFTLAVTDRVELNSLTGTVQHFSNGVMSDASSAVQLGSDFPLIFGADECDEDGDGWPTLEITSGLSTGGAEWIGRRTYV